MKLPQHCAGWVEDLSDPVARVQRAPHEGMRPCYRTRWADPAIAETWYCCKAHREREETISYGVAELDDDWEKLSLAADWSRWYANTFPGRI